MNRQMFGLFVAAWFLVAADGRAQALKSLEPPVLLPDGTEFKTWEARTKFARTYSWRHHWIIEDNTVRQVNGVGIDVGIQLHQWPQPALAGFHIVRRNTVTDCGICGICGLGPGGDREFGLLVEDNVVLRNAFHDTERLYETAGIKSGITSCIKTRSRTFLAASLPRSAAIYRRGSRRPSTVSG